MNIVLTVFLYQKICANILNSIPIVFETQYIPSWSLGKRYDFYIPKLNMIIETHCEQHYKHTGRGRSLKEEQENDKLKYELAIKNGIKPEKYIIVDCRKSELIWLIENFIKSLEKYFDLSNIDWTDVWERCQNSMIIDVCKYWESNNNICTISDVSLKFKLDRHTISRYLKTGVEIGMCNYCVDEQIKNKTQKVNVNKAIPKLTGTATSKAMKEVTSVP